MVGNLDVRVVVGLLVEADAGLTTPLGPFLQVGVEDLLPRRGMDLGGSDEDTVEVEQAPSVLPLTGGA